MQAKSEPIRLARNNIGLKLLQYSRDEAHRFAQHYHHILRRKAQLEEGIKQGRRPPKARTKAAVVSVESNLKEPVAGENPHTTLASLPILKPHDPAMDLPIVPLDAEDV